MTTPLHQRKIVRDAVVAALKDAATSAGQRVFSTRVVPWKQVQLPVVAVYGLHESSDDLETAPREYKRKLTLAVEAAVEPGENVDDALDAFAVELERAMDKDYRFGGACADSALTGTELEVAAKGQQDIGLLRLTYSVLFFTDAPDSADQHLDDLKTIDAKTSLAGLQAPADQVEDKLEHLDEATP